MGHYCAASRPGDDGWYRCVVTALHNGRECDVTFVDFGDSDRVPVSKLKRLQDAFTRLPCAAVR